jgi:hypothetical protein
MGAYAELLVLFGRIYERALANLRNKKNQQESDAISNDPVGWSNDHFNRLPEEKNNSKTPDS